MEKIRIRDLKVTKKQETETETDSGITNKWTYTLQDEEKENTITLKTSDERKICLGDTLDITLSNDQMTLDIHVENEAEALTDIIDDQGLMDKVVEEKEALKKILDKAKAAEADEAAEKGSPRAPSKKKGPTKKKTTPKKKTSAKKEE